MTSFMDLMNEAMEDSPVKAPPDGVAEVRVPKRKTNPCGASELLSKALNSR